MPTVLWLEWDRFYASFYESHEGPLIVSREGFVLDANDEARKLGVTIGIELREAKTLARQCAIKPWREELYAAKRDAWLDICADFTGAVEPLDQHIVALDLSRHPEPVEVAERLIRKLKEHRDLPLAYGFGPSKWIAKLASENEGLGDAVEAPAQFLAGLPVRALLPIPSEHIDRLEFLGYRSIREIAELPLEVLQGQFGVEGLAIQSAAQGRHSDRVQSLYPLDSLREYIAFETPVEDWEPIQNGLAQLADSVGKRLIDKSKQSSTLELTIEFEEGDPLHLQRCFSKPVRDLRTALASLRLLMPCELTKRVAALRVAVPHLQPMKWRQDNLDVFTSTGSRRPSADGAVDRARSVFGENSIRLARELEVARRIRVLKEWRHATGWS